MKRIFSTTIFAMTVVMAIGQTKSIMTLQECREMALENNASVKIARNNVEAAENVRREAFTKYFPEVQASGAWFRSNKPVFDVKMFDDAVELAFIKKGIGGGVTAIQPLFAGGRIVNGNRLAEVGEEASKIELNKAQNDMTLEVTKIYWQLSTLKSKRATLMKVIELVDTLQYQVGVAVDAGVTTLNDLLKVQLRHNELEAMLVDLDNGIDLCQNLLGQKVGSNIPVDIPETLAPDSVPDYPTDIYIPAHDALANTSDYNLLEAQTRAARLKQKIAVGQNMPTVGIGAGYFYDDILMTKHGFGTVMLNVTVPISAWWGGSHAIKKAKIEQENAVMEQENLGQLLEINMQNTWDDLTAAYRKMKIARESIGQSTENLRINHEFFLAGTGTITDLLDAQSLYRESCDSYTQAFGDFQLKRSIYLNATGQPID